MIGVYHIFAGQYQRCTFDILQNNVNKTLQNCKGYITLIHGHNVHTQINQRSHHDTTYQRHNHWDRFGGRSLVNYSIYIRAFSVDGGGLE